MRSTLIFQVLILPRRFRKIIFDWYLPCRYSYALVDRILPGPEVFYSEGTRQGRFDGSSFTVRGRASAPTLLFESDASGGPNDCRNYAYVGIRLFDAVSGTEIMAGTFQEYADGVLIDRPKSYPNEVTNVCFVLQSDC